LQAKGVKSSNEILQIQQQLLQNPGNSSLWDALKEACSPSIDHPTKAEVDLDECPRLQPQAKNNESFQVTLEAIAAYCASSDLKSASALLGIARHFATSEDEEAWVDFYSAIASKQDDNYTDIGIKLLFSSINKYPTSYACFELGTFFQHKDRARAYDLFVKALQLEPGLTEEAGSFAQNWVDTFFDASIYLRLNPELRRLHGEQLLNHYITYGISEGRIGSLNDIAVHIIKLDQMLPANFDWLQYKHLNPDLDSLLDKYSTVAEAELALKKHYFNHGKDEGRAYYIATKLDHSDDQAYQAQKSYFERQAYREYTTFMHGHNNIMIGAGQGSSSDLPLISIVVVTYNKVHLSYQCLRALANSSYSNIELILVDNASQDGTDLLLERVKGNCTVIQNTENLHFLKSCNQAFELASGQYVALVNNDAILAHDTIQNAYEALKRYNDFAIVGGKVLHVDGRIQDAGSIVFSDGSARGFGRRQLASDHRFSFERTVDYVSGCFLFTSAFIIKDLNGFDDDYSPAYYEETDLCFRARRQGIPIIYDPACVLHHYEFASSSQLGNDFATRQMKKNQALFVSRHPDFIESSLSPIDFDELDPGCLLHGHLSSLPKILVIDDRVAVYAAGSGFSRAADILDSLCANSAHVTIYATDCERSKAQLSVQPRLRCEVVEDSHQNLQEFLKSRLHFYDVIIVSRKHNHDLVSSVLSDLGILSVDNPTLIIYDVESLFSIRQAAHQHLLESGSILDFNKPAELESVCMEEVRQLSAADIILCVSDLEASLIKAHSVDQVIMKLGHTFKEIKTPSNLIFENTSCIGILGAIPETTSPNYDSLRWLNDEVLDAMVEAFQGHPPNILLAGNITNKQAYSMAKDIANRFSFLKFLGPVESLNDFFSSCRIFLAPTRYAAGIPHKVHQASSYGIPTVTTTLVAKQLGWDHGVHIMAAKNAKEIAESAHSLYNNKELWVNLATNMSNKMQKDCSLVNFQETLIRAISYDKSFNA
jgi:GT2 family glycosyltransferase/glycosyltransferase involved in cell wall biosynthesis